MRIVLSGYYGFNNVGDEAVLEAIVQGLRQQQSDIEITVLSAKPKLTREFYQVEAIHRYNTFQILLKLWQGDVLISGGGTLLQNITSNWSLYYYLGIIALAKLLGKKVAILGQGFGPLKGPINRLIVSFLLKRVNLITVRDVDSAAAIQRLGIKSDQIFLTADPTFSLKLPKPDLGRKIISLEAVQFDRPLVGIALRNVHRHMEENFYRLLPLTIDWLAKKYNYSPLFLLFSSPKDMGETAKIINLTQTKSNVIFRITKPDEMLSIIANCDLLIGTRLHSLIFAAINEVPAVGLSSDPKVLSFMKELGQPCFDLAGEIEHDELCQTLAELIKDKIKVKTALAARKKELHKLAAENFKLFFDHFKK
jgi:polysaccharide pyruvyl transferase CsaB